MCISFCTNGMLITHSILLVNRLLKAKTFLQKNTTIYFEAFSLKNAITYLNLFHYKIFFRNRFLFICILQYIADDKSTKILRTHLLQECNSENAALELKKSSNKTRPTLKKKQLIAHGHEQPDIQLSVIFSSSLFSTFLVYQKNETMLQNS